MLLSTVIEQQNGSWQFSGRDRARARATVPSTVLTEYAKRIACSLRPKVIALLTIAKLLKSEGIFVSRRGVAKFHQEYT